MADLNETLVGVEDEDNVTNNEQPVTQEIETKNKAKKDKQFPCEKCDKVFEKDLAMKLHMSKSHDLKSIKYTPRVINKKVANISTKFMCETCKVKKPTENELRTHIQMIHKREKKNFSRNERWTHSKSSISDFITSN